MSTDSTSHSTNPGLLRQRAEEMVQALPRHIADLTADNVLRLVHELRVHQIELELQNEELRQAQLSLSHSRDRFSDLYDFAPVGYVTLDPEGRILEANLAAAALLGIERQDLLQTRLHAFLLRDAQDTLYLHQQAVFASTEQQTCEVEIQRPDGSRSVVTLQSVVSRFDQNVTCRTALIDISDRRDAEQALRELNAELEQRVAEQTADLRAQTEQLAGQQRELRSSQEHLRSILNAATDAIITIDARGSITGANQATTHLFGYSQDELLGQNVSMLMPPPYCDEHDGYIARYLETRQARVIGIGREVIGRRRDGSQFPIDLAVSEIDHLGMFTGVVRDVSVRKRLEREILDATTDEQRRIGQELHDGTAGELVGLGIIADTLATSLTRRKALPAEQALAAQLTQGLKLAVTQIRSLAYGLVSFEVASHGLNDALAALAARVRELHGIDCMFECRTEVRIKDDLKATHLVRIAQEAIANALRHGNPQHTRILLEKVGQMGILQIQDDGQGFEVPVAGQGQSGLGLRSMQYRADQIAARLTVESSPGSGTQVTCIVSLDDGPS